MVGWSAAGLLKCMSSPLACHAGLEQQVIYVVRKYCYFVSLHGLFWFGPMDMLSSGILGNGLVELVPIVFGHFACFCLHMCGHLALNESVTCSMTYDEHLDAFDDFYVAFWRGTE